MLFNFLVLEISISLILVEFFVLISLEFGRSPIANPLSTMNKGVCPSPVSDF